MGIFKWTNTAALDQWEARQRDKKDPEKAKAIAKQDKKDAKAFIKESKKNGWW